MGAITNSELVEVITGGAFSGKTEELLRRLRRITVSATVQTYRGELFEPIPQVMAGVEESYAARCRNCHVVNRG